MNKYNLFKNWKYVNPTSIRQRIGVPKLPILLLITVVLFLSLSLFFYYFLTKNPQRDFSDYQKQAADALEYDRLLTNKTRESFENQVGSDVYHTLVLGGETDESSDLYGEYQDVFGGAAQQGGSAAELVSLHESQIQARGGVSTVDDLQKLSTGRGKDAVAYANITGETTIESSLQASD